MLEKIDSCLNELTYLCEEYKKQKPWFRKKNADVLVDLKKNNVKLNEIKDHIQEYDNSNILGKMWIGLRYPIGYYKELVQYYALNDLIQQASFAPEEERVFFLYSIISLLEKFSFDKIKNSISKIYNVLVRTKADFNADFDENIFSMVSVKSGEAVDVITVSKEKTPVNLEEIKHQNLKTVKNMIDLLDEMQAVDWRDLSAKSEDSAKQKYDSFMRKFDIVLRGYGRLRILTHPDHGTNESASLFIQLQETYNKFKDHKENIKSYVSLHGLKSLNEHIPKEEKSVKDLLEYLNATLKVLIANYDKYLKIFNELLPRQNEDLKVLAKEINDQSEAVDALQKENDRQDEDIEKFKKDLDVQSEDLRILIEDSNIQAEKLEDYLSEFDRKIQLLIDQRMSQIMGETSQTKKTNNDNTSIDEAYFERRNLIAYKEKSEKFDGTKDDKKEPSLG